MSGGRDILPLVISAPFGNYIHAPSVTSTCGTFTRLRRRGRAWRVLRTLRYHAGIRAWTNKIGLRNPGLAWYEGRVRDGRDDVSTRIVSIHGFDHVDWAWLIEHASALQPLAVELNMSCPNVGHIAWPTDLFARAMGTGVRIIVKLPPVNYDDMLAQALHAGVRTFHCCNTLPVPTGGMSGKPLMPVALQCIRRVRDLAGPGWDSLTIIGGGGITRPEDIDRYAEAGARRFAVGSALLHPKFLRPSAALGPLVQRAQERAKA